MDIKLNDINQNTSKENLVRIISQHEVFSDFSPNEVKQLNSIVSFRYVNKQDIIFEIDDSPNHIFYLLDGGPYVTFS